MCLPDLAGIRDRLATDEPVHHSLIDERMFMRPGFADSGGNMHILSFSSTVIDMLLRSFTPEPGIWTYPDVGGTLRLDLDATGYMIWFPCIYLHYVLAS
jgi:hypothetical protein